MSSFDQFEDVAFADNPDPRAPLVLVLDCSSSMAQQLPGENMPPLLALDSGLDTLVSELRKDPLARRRVETSFVTFGSQVTPATDFVTVDNLVLPSLTPMGATSMGDALTVALDALEARKAQYKANGVQAFRAWVMLLSDGAPSDSVVEVSRRIKELEEKKSLAFFAVGIDGADMEQLSSLGTRPALKLNGLKFNELFQWLSASQASVSASQPGDTVALPAPAGWAEV